MKVLVIPADTTKSIYLADVSASAEQQLDDMQKLVGGYIEAAPCPTNEITVWCNEEGKVMNPPLPFNVRATVLWERIWHQTLDDDLRGDIFITGGNNSEGDELPVPDYVIAAMQKS
jgi:hypothetical protein